MNKQNVKYAADMLLKDPETREELRLAGDPIINDDGSYSLMMENKAGDRKWKHTIRTEEVISENT